MKHHSHNNTSNTNTHSLYLAHLKTKRRISTHKRTLQYIACIIIIFAFRQQRTNSDGYGDWQIRRRTAHQKHALYSITSPGQKPSAVHPPFSTPEERDIPTCTTVSTPAPDTQPKHHSHQVIRSTQRSQVSPCGNWNFWNMICPRGAYRGNSPVVSRSVCRHSASV